MTTTKYKKLYEAFENRRFDAGQIKFRNHKITDKHIQHAIDLIAQHKGVSSTEIVKEIEEKIAKFEDIAQKAPILYGTIVRNVAEDTVFTMFDDEQVHVKTAPKFNDDVFWNLVYRIKAEHKLFLPLRSHLDYKKLKQPFILLTPDPRRPDLDKITTAAASPKGDFYFNRNFMQSLINFAHIKGLKPKGKKYECNGGDIPDEYGWIEFVIMHEFMHYAYDDFHYQNMIPKANPTIINWVGDFRSNYLLVKSGYDQLPMGLFNDDINYDRQDTYKEMYDLVKSEFDKLNKDQQDKVKQAMDGMSDDHGQGQEEGESMGKGKPGQPGEGKGKGKGEKSEGEGEPGEGGEGGEPSDEVPEGEGGWDKIDEQAKKVEERVKAGSDLDSDEVKKQKDEEEAAKAEARKGAKSSRGGRGSGSGNTQKMDFANEHPQYKWDELIKLFIGRPKEITEPSYAKMGRGSITGIDTARQIGAGAPSPGEVKYETKQMDLVFCVDSSGSMMSMIAKIFANIVSLLGRPDFEKSLFTLFKFSTTFTAYKGNFKKDVAVQIDHEHLFKRPTVFDDRMSRVFKDHDMNATNFSSKLSAELIECVNKNYNVIIFTDSDCSSGENSNELAKVLRSKAGKVFVIFDRRSTWVQFKNNHQILTPNVTYLENDN